MILKKIYFVGILKSKKLSFSFVYCLLVYCVHIYSFYAAGKERREVIANLTDANFEEIAFLYSYYMFAYFDVLPILFIFESPKIADFYNEWAMFQVKFKIYAELFI